MKRRELLALGAVPMLLAACASPTVPTAETPATSAAGTRPVAPTGREWRAAWIATVANIDWPSKPGLSAEAQQAEIRALCDTAQRTGLNALILQVRTSADALYESRLEPWSEYLTGVQGQHPGYDPLLVWLHEAKARGLELHAWLNPYRARHSTAKSALAETHLARARPDWVKSYGDQLWIDPGEEAAAEHTLAVVRDLLSRYEVDGVHIDDYFYPYPVTAATGDPNNKVEIDFPDDPSWQRYLTGVPGGTPGGSLSRADWRRYNVNRLVQRLYALVHEVRPGARLGISPFGLPKPSARPAGISGFSQYDKLYADVELWLREGWMDYLVPQLYWPRAQTAQAFEPLMRAWGDQNPRGLPIYPGLFTSKINDTPQSWPVEEVTEQIGIARRISAEWGQAGGHAHFSMVALAQNRKGVAEALRQGPYSTPR